MDLTIISGVECISLDDISSDFSWISTEGTDPNKQITQKLQEKK